MLRSDHVATFVLIVDTGSLNAAAGRLGLSRSVVSERLAALEADLGVRLVTRTTRGLSLTPPGERFLEHARGLLAAMDNARDAVAGAEGALAGRLRVAVPAALASDWLVPIFASFLEAHPRLSLEIAASDRTVDIVREGFDLAIRSARLRDSDLIARRLTTGRRIVVCSPDYARRHGTPGSLGELGRFAALVYRNRRITEDWTFHTPQGLRAARVAGRFEADDGAVLRQAAVAGIGLSLLPTFMVARDLVAGQLLPIDLGAAPDTDAIAAVFPRAHRGASRVRALIDHLQAALDDPPRWDADLAAAGLLALDRQSSLSDISEH